LAESGGALVWRINQQAGPSRLVPERGGSGASDRGILGDVERKPETVRLEGHSRVDRGEVVPLPANFGEDSTGLHPAAQAKKETLNCKYI